MITLDNLSNGDFTKWGYYQQLNVIEFLNICSYQKSKGKEEERQRRLQEMQMKTRR